MILTTHFEDGTTQDNECPDWARWVEYTTPGVIWVWEKKPKIIHSLFGFFCAATNKGMCDFIGVIPKTQRKNHRLQLLKIEFV